MDAIKFTISHANRSSRELTSVEFRILSCFSLSSRWAMRKEELLERIWGDTNVHAKTLHVHFSHLRHKLREIGVDIVHEGKSNFRISSKIEDPVEQSQAPG